MGWRTNLGLVIVVGGMAAYLSLSEPPTNTPPPTLTRRLLPRGAWGAKEVRFQYSREREPVKFRMDLQAQKFYVREPVNDDASLAVLKSILDVYEGALMLPAYTVEDLQENPDLLKQTGLKEPRGRFEVRYSPDADPDDRVVIEFGEQGIQANEVYALVGGEVYRVDMALYSVLEKNPDQLREKWVFPARSIGGVRRASIARQVGGETTVHAIEMIMGSGYRIVEPDNLRADQAMVKGLLQQVLALQIESFISGGAQNPNGAETPKEYVITLVGDQGTETLEISRPSQGDYFAHLRTRGINFSIVPRGLAEIDRWTQLLRARHMIDMTLAQMNRLELDPGVGREACVMVRGVRGAFEVERPIRAPKNATPVSELLHALTHLTAQEFIDEPPPDTGLNDGDEYFTVRIGTHRESRRMTSIRFGKKARDGLIYAKREDEKGVVLLVAEEVAKIRRPWIEFIGVDVPPVKGAFRLEVTVPGREAPIVYVNGEFEWREDGAGEADEDVIDLVDTLQSHRAKAALPESAFREDVETLELLFRGNHEPNTTVRARAQMQAHGESVLWKDHERPGVVFSIEIKAFRRLLDRWLAK